MHDWTIIANPWPGIRIVECAECGSKARRIGRPDTASVVDMHGRPVTPCQRVRPLALAAVVA